MNEIADLHHVTSWLRSLSQLCRHPEDAAKSRKEFADTLALNASLLSADFPRQAFTSDSLRSAAIGHTWFPAYDQIRKAVSEWWAAHKPAVPALTGPASMDDLDTEDRQWLAFLHKRRAEIAAKGGLIERDRSSADWVQTEMGNVESLVRTQSPKAWAEWRRSNSENVVVHMHDRDDAAMPPSSRMWNETEGRG